MDGLLLLGDPASAREGSGDLQYLDEYTHSKIVADPAARQRNHYITDVVSLSDTQLTFFRGYGGQDPRCLTAQTDLLLRIAGDDQLEVLQWRVEEHYDARVYAEGTTSASLREYLAS